MEIVLVILGTLIIDWLVGYLVNYNKKKNQKRDDDVFVFKLEKILKTKLPTEIKIDNSLCLCRNTKGEIAVGAYFALSSLRDE
tara:strand:- start:4018 stop:4266 length:249 start_codon:yes stop_codon:yes gene_type:complete